MIGRRATFQRLAEVLDEWRNTISAGLEQGKADGTVADEVNPEEAGTFVVAALMGGVGFAKNALDVGPFDLCRRVLETYVETLKPRATTSV